MPKTKYVGVYRDKNGKYFYQLELGIDKATGKRIQKKDAKIRMESHLSLPEKLIKS